MDKIDLKRHRYIELLSLAKKMDRVKACMTLVAVRVSIFLLTTGCSHLHSNIYRNEIYLLKKSDLEWQGVFKNTSILEIPIIKPNSSVIYTSSSDNPHGIRDMTVEYDSKQQIDKLISITLSRLKKKGFKINRGKVFCGAWSWRNTTGSNRTEYHGRSSKKECLYLEFIESENLVKVNVGIANRL